MLLGTRFLPSDVELYTRSIKEPAASLLVLWEAPLLIQSTVVLDHCRLMDIAIHFDRLRICLQNLKVHNTLQFSVNGADLEPKYGF